MRDQLLQQIAEEENNKTCSPVLLSSVCVCVCVCMCVCVFILFHLVASSVCKTSLTYLRCTDQRYFVASIIRASSNFLSYFTSKDEYSSPQLLERKRYDIIQAREKMIYIDIGYKSTQRQNRQVTE